MEELTCGLCLGPFVSPVTLACSGGHSFCLACISPWLARAGAEPTCPLDRQPVPRQPPAVTRVLVQALALLKTATAASRGAQGLASIPAAHLALGALLGEGAYGQVHCAVWQGTPVAVKSLQRAPAEAGEGAVRAFEREMRALGALRHPNIVQVLGVAALESGRVGLVMELAEGGALVEQLAAGLPRLPPERVVAIALDVARGLAYAHARGVAHNDLKSANVLLTAGGVAKLCDFGLVSRVRASLPSTHTAILSSTGGGEGGGLLGTPAFSAPENFEPGEHCGQPPGDIYSYACLLYELLSGTQPWAGCSLPQMVRAVDRGERPRLPEGLDERLAALVARCWAAEASARPTAAALVGELTGWVQRAGEQAAAAAAAPAAPAAATHSAGRIVSGAEDGKVRVWEAASGACLQVLEAHAASVSLVSALAGGSLVSGCRGCTLKLWDAATGVCTRVLQGHTGVVCCVCALAGGRLVSGAEDCTVRVWDAATGACERVLQGHTAAVMCVCALGGGRLASGSRDGTLRVWAAATGECLGVLQGHRDSVLSVCALGEGRLVSRSRDQTLRVWEAATGVCVRALEGHAHNVYCVCALGEGRLVSGHADKALRVWDVATGVCVRVLQGHTGLVRCLSALQGSRLVSGSFDGTLRVWDADEGVCLQVLHGHASAVYSLGTG